ncbi:RDD family protein [Cryptosporangium phraense]|uniref:RDD family protein n=1 Tax=Cryptosporangium phraense TaxID=2593070 RepID=A0A545AT79_9ACTN|nr:RDD family protein [Cryptosporangium phraense]TQS44534.1 RDD family protein [Cryptosporangium phraense]
MSARTTELPTGSFGRRFVAYLVDAVLCALVAGLFTYPDPPGGWSTPVFLVAYTGFVGLFGESPGLRLLGLRVEGVADGRPIGLGRALLRTLLIIIVIPVLVPSGDGRRYHDKVVGSIVTRRR